jgi:TetR/AcrR family transcriptional regulator
VTSGRRRGVESSASRAILIEAARQLLVEEGYPAVTARRVASRAGLKPQLVHYYFKTMDDLFVAVIRAGGEMMLRRVAAAVGSERPLNAVWGISGEVRSGNLWMEFLALANHRKAVRAEVRRYAEQLRLVQTAALTRHFEERGVKPDIPPLVRIILMASVSQLLMLEDALGISMGHAEAREFMESSLQRVERTAVQVEPPAAPRASNTSAGRTTAAAATSNLAGKSSAAAPRAKRTRSGTRSKSAAPKASKPNRKAPRQGVRA